MRLVKSLDIVKQKYEILIATTLKSDSKFRKQSIKTKYIFSYKVIRKQKVFFSSKQNCFGFYQKVLLEVSLLNIYKIKVDVSHNW